MAAKDPQAPTPKVKKAGKELAKEGHVEIPETKQGLAGDNSAAAQGNLLDKQARSRR